MLHFSRIVVNCDIFGNIKSLLKLKIHVVPLNEKSLANIYEKIRKYLSQNFSLSGFK